MKQSLSDQIIELVHDNEVGMTNTDVQGRAEAIEMQVENDKKELLEACKKALKDIATHDIQNGTISSLGILFKQVVDKAERRQS